MVPLKYGTFATKYPWIGYRGHFLQCAVSRMLLAVGSFSFPDANVGAYRFTEDARGQAGL